MCARCAQPSIVSMETPPMRRRGSARARGARPRCRPAGQIADGLVAPAVGVVLLVAYTALAGLPVALAITRLDVD
jgi:hypothetical protein